jgi:hypothetical protein
MSSSSCSNAPERRRCLRAGLALLALGLASPWARAESGHWRELLPQAQALGDGDLTWFGLRIYRATLWTVQRPFDPARPFALQLHYYRSISRARLVDASIAEISRLSGTPPTDATLARWRTLLHSAFVDVNAGDELTGVYLPQRGMRLYDRQKLLAELADPALARAFFDIWLNENSRDQTLRQRLLGGTP